MATTEITSAIDPDRRIIAQQYDDPAEFRLSIDCGLPRWTSIWLDLQARRELIEALIAILPKEGANGSFLALDSIDDDMESYRQWRREVGVPIPGEGCEISFRTSPSGE